MYAIFQSGGKQFRVEQGQILKIEKIRSEAGKTIEFNKVILVIDQNNIKIGRPFLQRSKIIAKTIENSKYKKITITKFRRRKHYRKKQGHRQEFTMIKIIDILS